jgi:hypothetical protein
MTQITQITQSGGNTNLRLRKACFTLNNYSEDEFTQLLRNFADMKYVIGKEIGDEGTPHLQGYVEFGKQLSFKQLKKINNRTHWERPIGTREQNRKYCCKEGNFVSTLPIPLNERLLNKYSDVVWKQWQQFVIDIVQGEPDTRTVHWFWERSGNVGKSFLCKYLYLKYDALICSGKKDDVFNQVKIWLDNHDQESPKLVICDIPRSGVDFVNYGVLEKLKDGLLYSGKYEGGVCALDNMHVICFANEPPQQDTMSLDRWAIKRIVNGTSEDDDCAGS